MPPRVRVSGSPRVRKRAASTRAADRLGRLAARSLELPCARPRNGDDEVEPVEQRPRELVAVGREPRCASRCTPPPDRRARRTGTGSSSRRAESAPGRRACRRPARRPRSRPRAAGAAPRAHCAGTPPARRGRARRGARGWPRPAAASGPPPTIAATDAVWCGARNGGTVTSGRPGGRSPATEWMRVTSSASSGGEAAAGFPAGGGRASSCRSPAGRRAAGCAPPAAASSSARRARSWPRTSARSGAGGPGADPFCAGGSGGDGSHSPRRYATASARWCTGTGVDPRERGLGRALGRAQQLRQAAAAGSLGGRQHAADGPQTSRRARARRPRRGRRATRRGTCREAASTASAIGRSKPEPSFRSSAGARLTVMRLSGPLQLGRGDPAADAMLRLLARAVG